MSTHYLVRCTGCKAIIEQCRCPGPKVEREGRCNTCDTPDEVAVLRSQLAAKDAEIERLKRGGMPLASYERAVAFGAAETARAEALERELAQAQEISRRGWSHADAFERENKRHVDMHHRLAAERDRLAAALREIADKTGESSIYAIAAEALAGEE